MPAAEEYVKVVPLQVKDDPSLPIQVCACHSQCQCAFSAPHCNELCICLRSGLLYQADQLKQVSKPRKAKAIKVSPDKLTIASTCGYRSAQSSKGAHAGTWYFEIDVMHLGATGHCRLGIGTHKQEIEAPCGYTDASYGIRDTDGAKVHKSLREPYGQAYKEGDTIGCARHPQGR